MEASVQQQRHSTQKLPLSILISLLRHFSSCCLSRTNRRILELTPTPCTTTLLSRSLCTHPLSLCQSVRGLYFRPSLTYPRNHTCLLQLLGCQWDEARFPGDVFALPPPPLYVQAYVRIIYDPRKKQSSKQPSIYIENCVR